MKLHSSQIEKGKMFGIILEHFGPSHRRNQNSVLRWSSNLNSYLNLIHIANISFSISINILFSISMQMSHRQFKCKISKTMVPSLCTKATLGNLLGLWWYVKISRETQSYSTGVGEHTNNQNKGLTSWFHKMRSSCYITFSDIIWIFSDYYKNKGKCCTEIKVTGNEGGSIQL